ncbi:MAG TPA: hypothetical protein VFJ05_07025 [Nitrososphaeraceae archaeon]|nr:hypothetical protein [Nitrososphaeraceae archaeon]
MSQLLVRSEREKDKVRKPKKANLGEPNRYCRRCGHKWHSDSKSILVTCSSCGYKVKRLQNESNSDSGSGSDNKI